MNGTELAQVASYESCKFKRHVEAARAAFRDANSNPARTQILAMFVPLSPFVSPFFRALQLTRHALSRLAGRRLR